MKNIFKVLVSTVAFAGVLVSCETYGDPDVDMSGVAPLDGRWICYAYDAAEYAASPATATRLELVEVYSSGTVDNAPDKLWLHVGYMLRENAMTISTVSVKADCNVSAKTFQMSGQTSVAPPLFVTPYYRTTDVTKNSAGEFTYLHAYAGYGQNRPTAYKAGMNVSVSDGQVTLGGFDTPSGHKSDHIKFTLELSGNTDAADNYKYVIEGHRHTGWDADYDETYDTASAHHKWNIGAYIEGWIFRRDGEWPIPGSVAPKNTFHTPN
ncbi:MAG: hypothetical protein LBV38_01500 [Alistipes sp.]|nr:hypothetical protein [Alistipes sp.]